MTKAVSTIGRDEWAALKYAVQLDRVDEGEGVEWVAFFPLLGRAACMAYGSTPTEAVETAERMRLDLYDEIVGSGIPIPLPTNGGEDELPSGRFLLRVPKLLHRRLQRAAEEKHLSLNQLCVERLERSEIEESLIDFIRREVRANVEAAAPLWETAIECSTPSR